MAEPPERDDSSDDEKPTLEAGTGIRQTAVMTTIRASSGQDSEPANVDPSPVSFDSGARYFERRVLGSGGMGEVKLCRDGWVGRDVAMKVMHAGSGSQPQARSRFLREARVQGQLEHPSVVPVYDLGRAADGGDFFTMKRVNGLTLEEIIAGLKRGDPAIKNEFTRRKLLSAMSQVCLAVEYAHRRGVVHRDLKPANVMLGDFGEVYVLDWGVAKIAGASEIDLDAAVPAEAKSTAQTEVGALVGTPGYMAPEQARGETDRISPATDVYALGAILFELLALEPLHRGKSVAALIASTLSQAPIAPSSWAPDRQIAPELDAICLEALALEPQHRLPSARALEQAIERYLSGERDAERRKELAREHLARAREALENASRGGEPAELMRSEGMRELSRALALDPTDGAALRLITGLVTAPATEIPPEAEAELKAVELRDRAASGRRAAGALSTWILAAPFFFFMGVKNVIFLTLFASSLVISAFAMHWMSATGRVTPRYMRIALFLIFGTVSFSSFLFGPFVFTPAFASVIAAAFAISLRANRNTRRFVYGLAFLAVFVPALLQVLGMLPRSYAFEGGVIRILPVMVNFPASISHLLLAGTTAVQMIIPSLMISMAIESLINAERKNFAQAWRLRQLLPHDPTSSNAPAR